MAGLVPFNRRGLRMSGLEDFNSMIDDFFNDGWFPRRSLMNDTFRLDVKDDDKEYHIDAELPGVKKEEISLDLNDGRLVISVKREENIENKDEKNYIHRERRYSSMQRGIYLADASEEGISAKLEDGILKISVPKEKKVEKSRKINIE